jgi:hypothetical protein
VTTTAWNFEIETYWNSSTKLHLLCQYSDWLRAGRPKCRSSSTGSVNNFSLLNIVQIFSRAHLVSYTMGTRNLSSGVKSHGREADHSHPSTAERPKDVGLHIHSSIHLHGIVLS